MGRRRNNPELVEELVDNLWNENYSQNDFEQNYNSLNSHDRSIVSEAIGRMEKQAEYNDMINCLW